MSMGIGEYRKLVMHDKRVIEKGQNGIAQIYKVRGGYLVLHDNGKEDYEGVTEVKFAFTVS